MIIIVQYGAHIKQNKESKEDMANIKVHLSINSLQSVQ